MGGRRYVSGLRIGIDAHVLGTRAGGNETYMRVLLEALRRHAPDAEITAFVHAEMRAVDLGFPTEPISTHSSYRRMLYALPLSCRRLGIDLVHVQYTGPLWAPCPFVVSLHDLVAFHLPETMPFGHRHRLRMMTRGTVRRAARIFVLTRAIQRDIAERFQVPEDRFDLVQPPVDPIFLDTPVVGGVERVRTKYGLPERFLLYVGLIQPRKNLARLVQAFARLEAHGLPHKLVIAGRRAWLYDHLLETINKLHLDDRLVFTDYVDHEDLPALYRAADAFAYLSLYEGFGIPVLEALACGTPTVASADPALVEVAGGAALHADACDTDEIEAALVRALMDEGFRGQARVAGPVRAGEFTLARMASAAMEGYAKGLASKNER